MSSVVAGPSTQPVLEVRDLRVSFEVSQGGFRAKRQLLRAVDGVSFTLHRGETLGLVGESGCGKSTTARAILRLVPSVAGRARVNLREDDGPPEWHDLLGASTSQLRGLRQHVQMIFQDPYASLNPRMTVGSIIAEPMQIFRLGNRRWIEENVEKLMREVGLDPRLKRRYPHEFSGGQCQRIGIARALALDPKVIICDEPVSALDVSIRAQVLNLLVDLQRRRGLAYVFIAHDLSVVRRISHRIAVMYLGKIVELADDHHLYAEPLHPYTEALLSAIPIPDPEKERARKRIALSGDVPSPTEEFAGCPFASRCHKVMPHCSEVMPKLLEHRPGHWASCLLHENDAAGAPQKSDAASSPQ
ncbi:Oligopeptide transport ATP-binding protein OppF [Planctomycetes bacterium Pan216]|uniref:Oligopeptide transport ATP-binding protein OppF n=1 Tax=Kolteria novifilia TaxID=2527975 RepID=A0A518B206_9BACT|nr:Oligopeptide transport ATP-binding protein OppF [Planctomycetes bacterium Pan216]